MTVSHTSVCLRLYLMDTRPSLDLILWNGPSAAAEALRSLRSFQKPEVRFVEQLNWDYGRPDGIWPGFSEYLQEKNHDISKVNTNTWDPIPGSGVILDNRVEDNEECGFIRCSFGLNAHRPQARNVMFLIWVQDCGLPPVRAPLEHCTPMADFLLDWHLLPSVVVLEEVLDGLPGHLGWNRHETQPLSVIPWSFTDFVNRHVSSGTQDWSEGKVLCKQCWLKLMGRHVLNSLRELKAQREYSCLRTTMRLGIV